MSQPYVGEIRMFAGNYAPVDWAFCDGSLVQITQYDALFNLIGTTYGGDGIQTFALPDLRGRIPIHYGQGPGLATYVQGEMIGSETVTLTAAQIPAHQHPISTSANPGDVISPTHAFIAETQDGAGNIYQAFHSVTNSTAQMNPESVGVTGGGQPHDNMPPYLSINFIIALFGIFPSQA